MNTTRHQLNDFKDFDIIVDKDAKVRIIDNALSFTDIGNHRVKSSIEFVTARKLFNGVSENEFAPDEKITREQIAAIMQRYAQYKEYDVSAGENTNILSYDDYNDISEYAIASVQYAAGSGLMKGKTESTFNPKDNTTRAEIATILRRFIETNR